MEKVGRRETKKGKHLPDESVQLVDLKSGIINETEGFCILTLHIIETRFGLMDETGHLMEKRNHLPNEEKCFIGLMGLRLDTKECRLYKNLRPKNEKRGLSDEKVALCMQ